MTFSILVLYFFKLMRFKLCNSFSHPCLFLYNLLPFLTKQILLPLITYQRECNINQHCRAISFHCSEGLCFSFV